jgi:hypothetical protein
MNCPIANQTTSKTTTTSTITTAVAAGVTATWPVTTTDSVSTIAFGKNVNDMVTSKGTPSSYIPTATGATGAISSVLNGEHDGVSNKVIIGVTVGLVFPILLALIAGLV